MAALMTKPLRDQLEEARRELLDLTTRNRLLHTPLDSRRSSRIDITDERSEALFQLLVHDSKELRFLPAAVSQTTDTDAATAAEPPAAPLTADPEVNVAESQDTEGGATGNGQTESAGEDRDPEVPDDSEDALQVDAGFEFDEAGDEPNGVEPEGEDSPAHHDIYLQTSLGAEKLQSRLLRMYYDARLLEEEQGINNLFLALGFLEWFDPRVPEKSRYAPLLLIPVELQRTSARARFRLGFREDEITTNLSLEAKLLADFGIRLPAVPEIDELDPAAYFDACRTAIAEHPQWRIHGDRVTLWFFSFSKFLMFRDLDCETWPEANPLDQHPLVNGLLEEGFADESDVKNQQSLDERVVAEGLACVVDSDSSQTESILAARTGRNLVIQGPPGTGKSQTITNLIAAAVHDGQKVLFVSEKMAALEVVKSRLDRIGLGDMCLELHSHKANKRSVLQDIQRTLDLGPPRPSQFEQHRTQLQAAIQKLNAHADRMHRPVTAVGETPFDLIGKLVRLQNQHTAPLTITPQVILSWNHQDWLTHQRLLKDVVAHCRTLTSVDEHAWRGVGLIEPLLPSDQQRWREQIQTASDRVARLTSALEQITARFPHRPELSESRFVDVEHQLDRCQKLLERPAIVPDSVHDSIWEDEQAAIEELVELGLQFQRSWQSLQDEVSELVWQADLKQARLDLGAYGGAWYRWFIPGYYRARNTLSSILKTAIPAGYIQQLQLLDELLKLQKLHHRLESDEQLNQLAEQVFGSLWKRQASDFEALNQLVQWEAQCRLAAADSGWELREIQDWAPTEEAAAVLKAACDASREAWEASLELTVQLNLNTQTAFAAEGAESIGVAEFHDRARLWIQRWDELSNWIALQQKWRTLREHQLSELVAQMESGELQPEELIGRCELAYVEGALRRALSASPELGAFDPIAHDRLVAEFQRLDMEVLQLARSEVARVHYDQVPRGGDFGELGILRAEARKKRRQRSIRRLLSEAGRAVQLAKPVFMMSPISIARFLEPGDLQFDLLVIDEASQVRPVDALGAIGRCRRMVVVGDHRQLPPTDFFNRVMAETEDESDDLMPADVESILDLCVARNVPQLMLNWHYRSQHHSLIAVSNEQFYDGQLNVIPSPDRSSDSRGLQFRHVADGWFDRGKSRTNRVEARVVAEAVVEHIRTCPDQSLGVGTFSVAQRDAIISELERLRRGSPELEPFFVADDDEPFFVKNLENIQGDERDVILISVGYARDQEGKLHMAFGPLSAKGGERRLNVLITRARQRCQVFCSFQPSELDLSRTSAVGTAALKRFLEFAASGASSSESAAAERPSEFIQQVAKLIEQEGFEAVPAVGLTGCFVDIAVAAQDTPNHFFVGIECDGQDYASARWCRDRDRTRQQVLERLGWDIERIWSAGWLRNHVSQVERLTNKLHQVEQEEEEVDDSPTITPPRSTEIVRQPKPDHEFEFDMPAYEQANFPVTVSKSRSLLQVAEDKLSKLVVQIVTVEGPIHAEEVARRLCQLSGRSRCGNQFQALVARLLRAAAATGRLTETEADFYHEVTQKVTPVRNRSDVTSTTLRKPAMLPGIEIQEAIRGFVRQHISVTRDEAMMAAARCLGFQTTTAALKRRIEPLIEQMLRDGMLAEGNQQLSLPPSD